MIEGAERAAQLALLVQCAMDMTMAGGLAPPASHGLSPSWRLLGHLVADDHLTYTETKVCYGFVAQNTVDPTQFLAAIRGTYGWIEWVEDADFVSIPHHVAGRVERGFWDVYASMRYVAIGAAPQPAATALAAAIGQGSLTIAGHSLGAAVATYLTLDVALLIKDRVSACLLASPQPGNAGFCLAFDACVTKYQLFDFVSDIVPRVPAGPDYSTLPRRILLTAGNSQALIRDDVADNHHVVGYAARLDYAMVAAAGLLPSSPFILGPAP